MAATVPTKISIITACYNSEKYIEDAIQSVLGQTYPHIEYLIIDGASSDGTMEIINKYKSRISLVVSEPDKGVYDAFNKGIQRATGELVYFLNSDDYLYENDTVERMVSVFQERDDLNAVYGNILLKDDAVSVDQVYGRSFEREDFIRGYMPPHQSLFVRKAMFEKYGGFNLKYRSSGDFDFISKLYLNEGTRMLYLNQIVAVFRRGGLSTNYRSRIIGLRETEQLIERHFGQKADLSSTEIQNNALYRCWLESWVLRGRGITAALKNDGISNVVIFGTMKTACYLHQDLIKEGFHVKAFIDNNPHMQGKAIEGVRIVPSEWLHNNQDKVDAIIVSLENANDARVIEELKQAFGSGMRVVSWKELIEHQGES